MKKICGIIIGETRSEEDASNLADNMKNCPNLLTVATASNKIYCVFVVPQEKEWWLRYPEKNPKATGLEKASVYIARNITYPNEFSPRFQIRKRRRRHVEPTAGHVPYARNTLALVARLQ